MGNLPQILRNEIIFIVIISDNSIRMQFLSFQEDEFSKNKPQKSPCQSRRVTDSEVEEYLSSEPALAALNIGLHVGRVKQAIKDKLEESGVPFSSSDALIEATLNLQTEEEDEDSADGACNSRLSQGVTKVLSKALHKALTEASDKNPPESPKQQEEEKKTERPANLSLEEENRLLKEARMCKICMDAEVGIVFLPCGHLTTCIACATNLQYCPLCRCTIKATVRTFLS